MWYLIFICVIWAVQSVDKEFNECYKGTVTGHGTATIDGSHLEYDIYDDKWWVYQCDQIIGEVGVGLTITSHGDRRRLSPAVNENDLANLWSVENGFVYVPYSLASELSSWPDFNTAFNQAKSEFDTRTNVRLVPYTNQNHYIQIIKSSGCWSQIGDGRGTAYQTMSIGDDCQYAATIIHEMLHALGVGHTQTREDRDGYVNIDLSTVASDKQHNFNKLDGNWYDDCGYYDYGSVMHYPSWAFGSNGAITIGAKQAGGQGKMDIFPKPAGSALSQEDINCLNYLYRPTTIPVRLISTYYGGSFYLRHSGWQLYSHQYEDRLLYQQDSTFLLRYGKFEFQWSYAGAITGQKCVQWHEAADQEGTWHDNYLCSAQDYGIRWSSAGAIGGMRCTHILESADPNTWDDNYLCVPNNSPVQFSWSSAGPIDGENCVQTLEPADPHTWDDNYLCYKFTGPSHSNLVSFESTNYPGHYIRHSGFRLRIDPYQNSHLYEQDASFYARPALNGRSGYTSYESKNYPGRYIREINQQIWLHPDENSGQFKDQASFKTECTFVHQSQYTNTCPTHIMNFLNEPALLWTGNEKNIGGWTLFEGTGKWYECENGYVIAGFWRNDCQALHCIEEMKCVRPTTRNIVSQTCQEVDISSAFDNQGAVECPVGYFIRGIWSNNNNGNCGLYCWERLKCCKYDENVLVYDPEPSEQNWWDCFDGHVKRWCNVDQNKYITGFYRSGGHQLFNLEIAKTRKLYFKNRWTSAHTAPQKIVLNNERNNEPNNEQNYWKLSFSLSPLVMIVIGALLCCTILTAVVIIVQCKRNQNQYQVVKYDTESDAVV